MSETTWCPAEEAAFFDVLRDMAGSAVEHVLAAAGQRLPRRSPKQARAAATLGSATLRLQCPRQAIFTLLHRQSTALYPKP